MCAALGRPAVLTGRGAGCALQRRPPPRNQLRQQGPVGAMEGLEVGQDVGQDVGLDVGLGLVVLEGLEGLVGLLVGPGDQEEGLMEIKMVSVDFDSIKILRKNWEF